MENSPTIAAIPMRTVGPIRIITEAGDEKVNVPLATYESPLWPSVKRGGSVSVHAGGIKVTVVDDKMTRSIALEATSAQEANSVIQSLPKHREKLEAVAAQSSRFAQLMDWHHQIVGNLIYLRFEFKTGEAAGHNMTTAAADLLMNWLLESYPCLSYVSISGNYCTDKKNSSVNGILGRGKYVIAELEVSRKLCARFLKTTPEKIVHLNVKKNLIGSIIAGSIRSANAHFANMLLAFYLATGQDAANIVEGSQGIVHAELREDHLYFSATLPNLILGTVGNGKDLPFVHENLAQMGCLEKSTPGANGRRLAAIAAATVLCGELSLLSAQTNPGELMQTHLKWERKEKRNG